jgi:hypothetical protein
VQSSRDPEGDERQYDEIQNESTDERALDAFGAFPSSSPSENIMLTR